MGYFKHTLLFFRLVNSSVPLWKAQQRLDTHSLSLVVATVLVAECRVYWQLLLCQGLMTGISCGMIFGPVLAIVGHWFRRKRALALGITSFGGAAGGILFPIATRKLFEDVGCVFSPRPRAGCDDEVSKISLDNANHCLDSTHRSRHCQPRKRLPNALTTCYSLGEGRR